MTPPRLGAKRVWVAIFIRRDGRQRPHAARHAPGASEPGDESLAATRSGAVITVVLQWKHRHGPWCGRIARGQRRQSHALLSLFVKIRWMKPPLEGVPERGPLPVNYREPGRITIAAFDDRSLPKNTLKRKAQALSGSAGW